MTDHTFWVDDEYGPVCDACIFVKDTERLSRTTMRPEVGKQRMTNATQSGCPGFLREHGIDAEAHDLGIGLFKLLQRTVDSRSLIASAASECERVGV